jgi:hypothetical protein
VVHAYRGRDAVTATGCRTCLDLAARARLARADAEERVENAAAGPPHRLALAEACGLLEGSVLRLAQDLERHALEHARVR